MRSSALLFLKIRPIIRETFGNEIYSDHIHLDLDVLIVCGGAITLALSVMLSDANH